MKKVFVILAVLTFVFALVPLQTHAQATGFLTVCGASRDDSSTKDINETQPCGLCQIFQLINKIVSVFVFPLAPIAAGVFIVIGGVNLILGGGDPERLNEGKRILTAVVIGLIIIYASWLFIGALLQGIGVADWRGIGIDLTKWWVIPCPK